MGAKGGEMARILVIDDDQQFREMITLILEGAGHQVVTAADGTSGVESCRAHPQDLIITDIFMPEKDGLETIQELRVFNPNLKILAISGGSLCFGSKFGIHIADLLGANRTLSKPLRRQELLGAVESLLA